MELSFKQEISVGRTKVGKIIGKGGSKIRDIREQTGSQIQVSYHLRIWTLWGRIRLLLVYWL
jgi:predicted RNA-binding protein YlqC (UPF0109 family)